MASWQASTVMLGGSEDSRTAQQIEWGCIGRLVWMLAEVGSGVCTCTTAGKKAGYMYRPLERKSASIGTVNVRIFTS